MWTGSAFGAYLATLVRTMSWRVALALTLMLCRTVTQGAQLLLLIPLMQLVGLDVQKGSVSGIAKAISSLFAAVGLRPTVVAVLGIFVFVSVLLALVARVQTSFNFKLEQDFVADLRRRLYRAIANMGWLHFARQRSSDFTHALTTELRAGRGRDRLPATARHQYHAGDGLCSVGAPVVSRDDSSGVGVRPSAAVAATQEGGAARSTGKEVSLSTKDLYSATIEDLAGMKTAKSYGVEERNADIFSGLVERVARTEAQHDPQLRRNGVLVYRGLSDDPYRHPLRRARGRKPPGRRSTVAAFIVQPDGAPLQFHPAELSAMLERDACLRRGNGDASPQRSGCRAESRR